MTPERALEQLRKDQMLGVIKEFVQQEVPNAKTDLAVVNSNVVVAVSFPDGSLSRHEYRITIERVT